MAFKEEPATLEMTAELTGRTEEKTDVGKIEQQTKTAFDFASHKFVVPKKTIDTPNHVGIFGKS